MQPAPEGKPSSNQVVLARADFSGPIPPPRLLAEYEEICPGLADRIVSMAEKESAHRHTMDGQSLSADIDIQRKMFQEARVGQICALSIGITAIIAGTYAATHGAQLTGGLIGGGGVVGLVTVFVLGRRSHNSSDSET